ncbi:Xylogen-like protein 11 [Bienertia sinuspersici]
MTISPKISIWVIVILGLISVGSLNVRAQSAAPAPAPGPGASTPDCMTALYNMSDCLTYVEKGSNLTKPDKNCCPEIAGMLDSNPICLCQLLGKSKDFGLELDMKRALKMPTACKLQAPDPSLCSAVGVPIGAPAGGPASTGGLSSDGPSSSSPGNYL